MRRDRLPGGVRLEQWLQGRRPHIGNDPRRRKKWHHVDDRTDASAVASNCGLVTSAQVSSALARTFGDGAETPGSYVGCVDRATAGAGELDVTFQDAARGRSAFQAALAAMGTNAVSITLAGADTASERAGTLPTGDKEVNIAVLTHGQNYFQLQYIGPADTRTVTQLLAETAIAKADGSG